MNKGKFVKNALIGFGAASAVVAIAGEIVALRRDLTSKPGPDALVGVTSKQAQQVIADATYGTDIVLDAEQTKPTPGLRDTYAYHVVKRGFDLAFSSAVVVASAIPMGAVCGLIYLDHPGKPIYKQRRVGRYGVPIEIYKLRTMVPGADRIEEWLTPEQIEQWLAEHKVDDDPRVTKIGKVLRATSLDELPQFLNVLTGEMSVIGPRPVEPDELAAYKHSVVEFLSVTPGITGWWQVKARNDASYADGHRQQLELEYVRDRGLKRDLQVFLGTFGAMFGKHKTGS